MLRNMNAQDRFWSKVSVGVSGLSCWVWEAGLLRSGYGNFRADDKHWRAHRWAWTDLVGSIPEGMVLDHLCRNKRCVNPDHLEVVTVKENTIRSGAAISAAARMRERPSHCREGHALSGKGRCRECRKAYDAKRNYAEERQARRA